RLARTATTGTPNSFGQLRLRHLTAAGDFELLCPVVQSLFCPMSWVVDRRVVSAVFVFARTFFSCTLRGATGLSLARGRASGCFAQLGMRRWRAGVRRCGAGFLCFD